MYKFMLRDLPPVQNRTYNSPKRWALAKKKQQLLDDEGLKSGFECPMKPEYLDFNGEGETKLQIMRKFLITIIPEMVLPCLYVKT